MITKYSYSAWMLSIIALLFGITEGMAQTYERNLKFKYTKEDFTVEENERGSHIIANDEKYDWTYQNDISKPALPFINYSILLPDNCKLKEVTISTNNSLFAENIILAPNPVINMDAEEPSSYPTATYTQEIICTSEEVIDGYRIAHFSLNPFCYYTDTRKLTLAKSVYLTIIIERMDEDNWLEYEGTMTDSIKSLLYNPEDIDKGTENWEKTSPTLCTVGNIDIKKRDLIERLYTKDWNIRFATPKYVERKVQAGIMADSIYNGTKYQIIRRIDNGDVAGLWLYRQKGNKVYRYSEVDKKEILLFDFGLNEGDDYITPNGEVWIVDSINEKSIYGIKGGKALILKGKEDNQIKDIWLEHVGSIHTGIFTYDDFEKGSLPQLTHCRQADYGLWKFDMNTAHCKITHFNSLNNDDLIYLYTDVWTPEESYLFFDDMEKENEDVLLARFEKDTLHIYGHMRMNCYTYQLECHIREKEIKLETHNISFGSTLLADCEGQHFVSIKIPGIKAGDYNIKYTPMNTEDASERIIEFSPYRTSINIPKERRERIIVEVNANTLLCTAPNAVKLEIYTMDAVKVGEAQFTNGTATVTVNQVPATYLYIVTYPDGRRESGKVRNTLN